MKRKNYILLAESLITSKSDNILISKIANYFSAHTNNFNKEKFMEYISKHQRGEQSGLGPILSGVRLFLQTIMTKRKRREIDQFIAQFDN